MKNQKKNVVNYISMWVLLLAPILWIYGNIGGWSIYAVLSLLLGVLVFTRCLIINGGVLRDKNPLPQWLLFYFVYWGVLFSITARHLPLAMIQVYLTFFLFFVTFSREYFVKIYKTFGVICIIIFILQEFTYQTTGVRISGVLTFLPLSGDFDMNDLVGLKTYAERSSSIFAEPSHFAQFLLPLLAIEIYYDRAKTHIVYAITIIITLLILRSGNGLLGMAAVLSCLIPYYFKKSKKNRWLILLFFAFVFFIVGYYYINSEMGNSLIERQSELGMEYEGGSRSGFLRIWRGIFVFNDYSLFEKIFGCPNEITQLAHVNSSGMQMAEEAELYFNAFQKVLLNTGFIGVIIFVCVISRMWRGNTDCGKAIIMAFIALSFVSGIYMSHTMILYLVLAESMKLIPKVSECKITNERQYKVL